MFETSGEGVVDLKQIKELMAAMGRAGIKKVSIKEKAGFELQLESHEEIPHPLPASPPFHPSYSPQLYSHAGSHASFPEIPHPSRFANPPEKPEVSPKESGVQAAGQYITSPMVGTYYSAASPDDPVFVKVGDVVNEGTIVCIIEAMKVMNEVKAGVSGVIAEICAENAHPVEFGMKLFRIQ
jgi:acetyl-CoA carboxylase biotin carboxyl carrier protein